MKLKRERPLSEAQKRILLLIQADKGPFDGRRRKAMEILKSKGLVRFYVQKCCGSCGRFYGSVKCRCTHYYYYTEITGRLTDKGQQLVDSWSSRGR